MFWHDLAGDVQPEAIPTKFNWTISFRFDSEASMGVYGITVLRPKMLSTDEFNSYIDEQFTKRQSYALWFVSNCNSKVRLNYYEQLQSVYPRIKIHGDCVK